jgi:hypothetical protein
LEKVFTVFCPCPFYGILKISVAEPHHLGAASASGKENNAALDPERKNMQLLLRQGKFAAPGKKMTQLLFRKKSYAAPTPL